MSESTKDQAAEAGALVERARQLFAGRHPDVQGAALCDLLSMWLAGHRVRGDADATKKLRADLLSHHINMVLELLPANDAALDEAFARAAANGGTTH